MSRSLSLALRLLPPAALLCTLAGCAGWRVDHAARSATGFASHLICDDTFVTGRDPDLAFAERVAPLRGMGLVRWALRREVDTGRREVTVSVAGAFESRARWRDGLGCAALPAGDTLPAGEPAVPAGPLPADDIAGPAAVVAAAPALRAALAHAIDDPAMAGRHRTKAIVVLRGGHIVAEHYAPGYGPETPMLGFSMTKSVTNALVGILVRQGRLALEQPAPVPAWQGDARRAITVAQLLRQTSGLALEQDNSGFDFNARLMYTVADKAAAAAAVPLEAPPGTRWAYADGHYMLLSGLLRDAVGGRAADVQAFAQRELFGPLGLQHVVWDYDAAGTPIGSSHLMASPRDWARFGRFLLDDGVVAGRRLLPEGWLAWSTSPTLATGYGAGFWTNRVPGPVPGWDVPWGLPSAPADAYFARGFMGQFIVVVPGERLVLVRLSVSHERGDDIAETDRLLAAVRAAL